jgi:glutamate/tyrosine decarboxylase-like PLP-dependent enzyme
MAQVRLDLDAATREQLFAQLGRLVEQHHEAVADLPVAPQVEPETIRRELQRYDFAAPIAPADALNQAAELLAKWTVHTTNPAYFGLFNPTPAFMGIAGDALAAAYNPQMAAWSHAPAAVEIERHLINFFGERFGFPGDRVAGSFTQGGAEANLTAVLLALTRRFPDYGDRGLRVLPGQPVFYASAESHLAWLKIAHATGLGRDAVRLVPVTDDLKLDTAALQRLIAGDRAAGNLPFLVVATAGTTANGIIDPLPEIAELCAREQVHFHVDAAWAGAAVLSDRLRPLLAGIERADSITIDAHKWLSVPMAAGMFICTDAAGLGDAFRVSTAYMPPASAFTADPYTHTMQWSRRFIGLKLFLALAVAGRDGYADQLEHDVRLGDALRDRLRAAGWRIVNDTPFPVISFDHPGYDALPPEERDRAHQRIADTIVAGGSAWISTVKPHGRTALRACIISYRTIERDLDNLIAALDAARRVQ